MVTVKDKNGKVKQIPVTSDEYLTGEVSPIWSGMKHTDDTKRKMSNSHKINGDQRGKKNSQYGTHWLTKGGKNLKVKDKDLNKFLADGWSFGRKMKNENIKRKSDKIPIDDVLEMRKNGASWKEIQDKHKIGKTTLLRYRKRNNI